MKAGKFGCLGISFCGHAKSMSLVSFSRSIVILKLYDLFEAISWRAGGGFLNLHDLYARHFARIHSLCFLHIML